MARHEQITPGGAVALAANISATVPTLVTERLTLRAPRLSDFPLYAEVAASNRSSGIGGPMTRDEAWADWIQLSSGWMLHGHGGWSVFETKSDHLLGIVCVCLEPGDREPELGYIFSKQAEGHGFAYEAATAARDWAFTELGLETLVSYVGPNNERSIRLTERLGARRDPAAEAEFDFDLCVYRHPNPQEVSA